MATKRKSAFAEMLTTMRRIVVLSVAAHGLWNETPYDSLLIRLAVLWAVMYLACKATELLFQFLAYQARKTDPGVPGELTVDSRGLQGTGNNF